MHTSQFPLTKGCEQEIDDSTFSLIFTYQTTEEEMFFPHLSIFFDNKDELEKHL